MLHVGVLPHHDRWGGVLANLAYVVVDEAHVYRGVFGSHVGNVLRRLRRMARVYGADPQFLLASRDDLEPRRIGALAARPGRDGGRRRRGSARRADDRLWNPNSWTRSSASARALSERHHG
jgi:DEAD/DEAH box helicase domain-containing protein